MSNSQDACKVTAILGPTNTGKTHLALERMLGHRSGIIGLPLRLLAREIYDKITDIKGLNAVALITGEEKIIPNRARYFVCTTESVPTDREVDFVAIDEIQLVSDPERGHIFTDRLLNLRGRQETAFLGAETVRPILNKLVPEASFESRIRLSKLSYSGYQKLSRIGRRSAIVAFSAEDVYSIAELVRRHRGGAAVVLGALSPRTRNAQVAMFENGDVDYLIATDAIGLGLNLNVDHVAFSSLHKFDGNRRRQLTPQEIAQIAGRAGRHLSNGTFGLTSKCPEMDSYVIERIENHNFDKVKSAYWRNSKIDFSSPINLLASLDISPAQEKRKYLLKPRKAIDREAFSSLYKSLNVTDSEQVRMLWKICQVPDYRKTLTESHTRLLSILYGFLSSNNKKLSEDWLYDRVSQLDRLDGDIDTLASRISYIRTWTYVCNRSDWIPEPEYWQELTRTVEDRLSDALHEKLTQRFVDRRSAALSRKLGNSSNLYSQVNEAGEVSVDGHSIGNLSGFRFLADKNVTADTQRLLKTAAQRTLNNEMLSRARLLLSEPYSELLLSNRREIIWKGNPIAKLIPGPNIVKPRQELFASDLIDWSLRKNIDYYLNSWLNNYLNYNLTPLNKLINVPLSPVGRGIVFQIIEGLGTVIRSQVDNQISALSTTDRKVLAKNGVRIGSHTVYVPTMLQQNRMELCAHLWALSNGIEKTLSIPANINSFKTQPGFPEEYYLASGFVVLAKLAIRADRLEWLINTLHKQAGKLPLKSKTDLACILGCSESKFIEIAKILGFILNNGKTNRFKFDQRKSLKNPINNQTKSINKDSAFAALEQHPLANTGD